VRRSLEGFLFEEFNGLSRDGKLAEGIQGCKLHEIQKGLNPIRRRGRRTIRIHRRADQALFGRYSAFFIWQDRKSKNLWECSRANGCWPRCPEQEESRKFAASTCKTSGPFQEQLSTVLWLRLLAQHNDAGKEY
jgi:hypothetical protein